MNEPLKTKARCIWSGGVAFSSARSAPCTIKFGIMRMNWPWLDGLPRMNITPNRFPLYEKIVQKRYSEKQTHGTNMNQRMAELPSAFLVTSQASSSPTGNKDKEQMPMIVITTNNPTSFPGLTAPMS